MSSHFTTLAGIFLAAALAPAPRAEDLTFKVQSQLVQIYLSVTDGDRRVTELSQSDFTVTEDGNQREIERLDSTTLPLHVALLLDTSGSMGPTLAATQEAAVTFIESLQPADRVSFIPFSSDVRLVPQLTDDRTPILSAIRNAQAFGATKLYDALVFAMKNLATVQGRKAVVVFSDGEDTTRTSSLGLVFNAAARHGFPIFTIAAREALRSDALRRVLRQLAEINRGKMFVVEDPRHLGAAFREVVDELRAILVINYYTNVPHDGRWHDVKVSLGNPRLKVHCRKGFFARTGEKVLEPEPVGPVQLQALATARTVQDAAARAAAKELVSPAVARALEVKPIQIPAPGPARSPAQSKSPLFRVETRFVEVPVLVESHDAREAPRLAERDFRIYEDGQLRDVAFFSRDVKSGSLAEPRAQALSKLNASRAGQAALAAALDNPDLKLGRYYLVLDDLLTAAGPFMQAKRAAEKIIGEFQDPLRPVSVHVLSEGTAEVIQKPDPNRTIEKIRMMVPKVSPLLTSNDQLLTIYQAFLIDRGDRQTRQLAELRYASSISAEYANDLGRVEGQPGTSPEVIQTGVANLVRQLISENLASLPRALDGLRAVVNAASADPGDYPKDVILLSSGFTLGRAGQRSDLSPMLDGIIAEAKRGKTRVHAVDATGLDIDEPIGMGADGSFLVRNPHLMSLLMQHAHGWRLDRQEPLSQLASETGGRFVHATNDLAGGFRQLAGTRGRIYYLGFLSQQPADGRFHSVRVTVSDPGARVHTRKGYFADAPRDAGNAAVADDSETLLTHARVAQAEGDMKGFAAALEPLAQRFPGQATLWYNLGVAHFRLANHQRAAEALQRAFALTPGDRNIGVTLARALIGAGHVPAAVQALQFLVRSRPQDIELLADMGRAYESDGRLEEAYQVYRRILDFTFAPPLDLYLLLARTSARLGRRVEARIFVEDYLSQGGSDDRIAEWRAMVR